VLDQGTIYVPGTILIGGYNSANVNGSIVWIDSEFDNDEPDSWETDLSLLSINGTTIDI
jgi:hypothetical protein